MTVLILAAMMLCSCASPANRMGEPAGEKEEDSSLEWIGVSKDGRDLVLAESGARFVIWGVNYDHDRSGRLIEDYWHDEWRTVVEDFNEIKALSANVVRVHLQVSRFMASRTRPNDAEIRQLVRLVALAESVGLYLDITGLGCYHKAEVPAWYDAMSEAERWEVQARFWEAVAQACAESPAVFCYDLMNEPILAGGKKQETEWLAGAFGGKHFVQRITLDLAGRRREEVAKAWIDRLVGAIHKHDSRHLVTVGVIPWAHTWPNAKPIFYAPDVGDKLDFVSVHFYPNAGEVGKALAALAVYDVGKPLVIEEMFSLKCGVEEMDRFIDGSRELADGWIGFYWGKTIEEYAQEKSNLTAALIGRWLAYFREKGREIAGSEGPGARASGVPGRR